MSKPEGAVRLYAIPMTFRQGSAWVAKLHRHNKPPRGHKFTVGAVDDGGTIHGIAMAGRPIARASDDGLTLEVYRSVTIDGGPPNVNSFLYAACWRVGREMGYLRCITMTQGDEPGTSLVAAGYRLIAERPARGSWMDSTADERLRAMRDQDGNGGMPRKVWEALARIEARPKRLPDLRAECRLYGLTPEDLLVYEMTRQPEGNCSLGVPEEVRRAASIAPPQDPQPVFLGTTIGRRSE